MLFLLHNPPHHNNSTQETGLHEQTTLPHPTMSWQHRSTSAQSVLFFVAVVLSQGLPVGCTPGTFPFTVVAIPGEYGNTTNGGNSSNVAYTLRNSGSSFVTQGEFRSGFAQQCASGVTDTLVFCVGETESDVYSLTVYDTAQPAFVVLVHDAPRYFDVGAGSGGMVFTAHQPGMLLVGVGTVLYLVDVTSPEDPKITLAVRLTVAQIVGVQCSGEHVAVHAVESAGVQESVYVYRFLDSILENVGEIPMNDVVSWDINGGVFAACFKHMYRTTAGFALSVATIGDTISDFKNISLPPIGALNYRVRILAEGTIAVFFCSTKGYVLLVSEDGGPFLAAINALTDTPEFVEHAEMVALDGYVFLTSAVSLHVLSAVGATEWYQANIVPFRTPMQITFTQSSPAAKNNVIMLTVAASLAFGCLLAVLAQLYLEHSKQSKERLRIIVPQKEDTTSTKPVFLVSSDLKRNSMWAEMPTASQSVTTEK